MTDIGPTQIADPVQEAISPIYARNEIGREIRQSEIFSNLTQYFYDPATENVEVVVHPFSIALTQDCDLLWDYESRNGGGGKALDSVLLFSAMPAAEARAAIDGDIWRRVTGNNNERYHLLQRIPADCDCTNEGITNLVVDFKSFFTLTPQEIYKQCAAGISVRRSRLEMPYREHLQNRAAFYFQRIVLPTPHKIIPDPAPATAANQGTEPAS